MTETTKPAFVPKIKGFVTLPQLKISPGIFYYVKFLSEMTLGKDIPQKATVNDAGEIVPAQKREPATVAQVLDLQSNAPHQIVCSTVLRKELEDWAKLHGTYVHKCFQFRITKISGKAYNLVEIAEIEDPTTSVSEGVSADEKQAAADAGKVAEDARLPKRSKTSLI